MRHPVLAIVGLTALACCTDSSKDAGDQTNVVVTLGNNEPAAWLKPTDRIDPAVWLANQELHQRLSPADPAVEHLREALARANTHFLESSRMLANRTAQLGEMLAADDRSEEYVALLEALSSVAAAAGNRQTYGAMCQHYFNLRHNGMEKAAALEALSEGYSAQRQNR